MSPDTATILTSTVIATLVSTVIAQLFQWRTANNDRTARDHLAQVEREAREKLTSDERIAREKQASDERIASARLAQEDRIARRKELLLQKATQMAKEHTERIMSIVEQQSRDGVPMAADLKPDIFLAEDIYRWLEHLLEHGELPSVAYQKLRVVKETPSGNVIVYVPAKSTPQATPAPPPKGPTT